MRTKELNEKREVYLSAIRACEHVNMRHLNEVLVHDLQSLNYLKGDELLQKLLYALRRPSSDYHRQI
jgi:hypothetical protein